MWPSAPVAPKSYLHRAVPALAVYGLILLGIGLLLPEGVLNYRGRRRRVGGAARAVTG